MEEPGGGGTKRQLVCGLWQGRLLTALFGADAATLTVGDIASISYSTFRPAGTPAGTHSRVYIYTRKTGSRWYDHKLINDTSAHNTEDAWVEHSTLQFADQAPTDSSIGPFGALGALYANELVLAISVQTWLQNMPGFTGPIDGLTVTLRTECWAG